MKPFLYTAPALPPVTVAELKSHLDITFDDNDTLLGIYIGAATALIDGYSGTLGRALITQTWKQVLPEFPVGLELRLKPGNVQSITNIKYYDVDNAEQTFSSASYTLRNLDKGYVASLNVDAAWPATYNRVDAITLTWVAGYGTLVSTVPDSIRLAILQTCAHWFENRETVNVGNITSKIPMMAETLLAPFKVRDF